MALLAWGLGGTVGAFGSGWLTDRYGAHRALLAAISLLTLTLAALGFAHTTGLVLVLMLVNGAGAWAVATPNNHRLTALAPQLPTVVISYNSSGIYLGQAAGSALGGLLLAQDATATNLCLVGACLGLGALATDLLVVSPWRGRLRKPHIG